MAVRINKKVSRKVLNTKFLLACSFLGLLLIMLLFSQQERKWLQDPELRSPVTFSRKPRYDAIFLVMGEQKLFLEWYNRLAEIDGIAIDLVFGYWDRKIGFDCVGKIRCDSMFLANTTWTTGRNALALRAAEMEVERGKKYDYWMFADDDLDIDCDPDYVHIVGKGSCWQKLFNFVISDYITGSDKVSSVGMPSDVPQGQRDKEKGDMVGATSFDDAMLAIFKRNAVPYLIPYASLRPDMSQWLSQGALFCIMKECMSQSLLFPPPASMQGLNVQSRPYKRGGGPKELFQLAVDNFNLTEHNFTLCNNPKEMPLSRFPGVQFRDTIRGDSPEALWDLIPESDWGKCKALKIEFWDKMVAHLDYRGVK